MGESLLSSAICLVLTSSVFCRLLSDYDLPPSDTLLEAGDDNQGNLLLDFEDFVKRAPFSGMRGKRAPFSGMRGRKRAPFSGMRGKKSDPEDLEYYQNDWDRLLNFAKRGRLSSSGFTGMRG